MVGRMARYPVVMVKFLDNAMVSSFDLIDEDVVCFAFGILLDENENYYHIAGALYGGLDNVDVFKVLKRAVVDMKVLMEAEIEY